MSFETKAEITSYAEAQAFLAEGAGRTKTSQEVRNIAYATLVERISPECIAILHHASPIVKYYIDGSIYIDNFGYETKTTKERIERFTPVRIDGSVVTKSGKAKSHRKWEVVWPDGLRREFVRGMQIADTTHRAVRRAAADRSQELVDTYYARLARQQMREPVDVDLFGHDEDGAS